MFSTPYLQLKKGIVSGERISQYKKPKIIFAKMAQRIEAFLDEGGDFASANTNFVYDSEYSLHYLVSVLNSKLLSILYQGYFGALIMSGGYFQYQSPQLRILPIRHINFNTPGGQSRALAKEIQILVAAGGELELLQFVEARLAAKPEESEIVHDLLTHLAKQMIDLNKQKQAEMKRLLGWLESSLHIHPGKDGSVGLDVLIGKSRLRNYLGDYQKGEAELSFEGLQDILFKNRNRLGVSLNDARFTARLHEEYEKSLAVLLPIKEKLRRTDALIDQIVYKLYGLTDEEIAVVEGKI